MNLRTGLRTGLPAGLRKKEPDRNAAAGHVLFLKDAACRGKGPALSFPVNDFLRNSPCEQLKLHSPVRRTS